MVVSGVMPPMRSVWAEAGRGLAGTAALAEELALVVLALLARVEAGHGAVVTHHAGPHLAGLRSASVNCTAAARAVFSVVETWVMAKLLGGWLGIRLLQKR